ncbi:MAG: hypothetical protein ACI4JB_00035 [Porcipelethomonas sp.]
MNDYIKGKIDRAILGIVKPMANLVYGTISLSEGLANVLLLLNCSVEEIEQRITNIHFPAFIALNKRYVDTDGGKVINITHYATNTAPSLRHCLSIKPNSIKPLAAKIYKLIIICKYWLDVTDSEFILDPDYYVVS